ncbi:MAG: ABC transporter substrate-binding protein [Oscillospiraceae bacterium]|jgi:ABC-type nitrate/sulfonate/bicarbonate transport system substrate-binding protein|nr:ABC transporter substrate-binding protein [Oscillospiraceae bacterium]
MKLKKSIGAIFVFALAAALLLSACGGGSAKPPSGSQTTGGSDASGNAGTEQSASPEFITLRTSTKKNCTSTPWVVGETQGIFEKHGIKIEYTGETDENLAAVLNGTNDFDVDSPGTLAQQYAEGTDIIGVAFNQVDPDTDDIDRKYQHMRFYVSPDSGLNEIADLQDFNGGGEITISGVGSSNCLTFIPQQVLKNHGLDPERLAFVGYDSDTAAVQLVTQGDLDIAGIHPPFYYLAEQEGLKLLFDSRDSGLGAATGAEVFYFTQDFVGEHPDWIQRFTDAITESQKWGLEHPDEAVTLTGEYIGTTVNAVHYFYNGGNVSGDVPSKLIQPWINDLVDYGVLDEGQVSVTDIFDARFINSLDID